MKGGHVLLSNSTTQGSPPICPEQESSSAKGHGPPLLSRRWSTKLNTPPIEEAQSHHSTHNTTHDMVRQFAQFSIKLLVGKDVTSSSVDMQISRRTNEFALILSETADVKAIHDALREENVFFHTYTHEMPTGAVRTVLLINAPQERLWLGETTMQLQLWTEGTLQGDMPNLTFECPPDFYFDRPARRLEVLYHILTEDVWVQYSWKDGTRSRIPLLSEANVERCCCLHDQHSNWRIVFGSGQDTWVNVVQRGGGLTRTQIADLHSHFGDETGWQYAWSTHYLKHLRYPALVGSILQVICRPD